MSSRCCWAAYHAHCEGPSPMSQPGDGLFRSWHDCRRGLLLREPAPHSGGVRSDECAGAHTLFTSCCAFFLVVRFANRPCSTMHHGHATGFSRRSGKQERRKGQKYDRGNKVFHVPTFTFSPGTFRRCRVGLTMSVHRVKADIAAGRAGGLNQRRPAAFPVYPICI